MPSPQPVETVPEPITLGTEERHALVLRAWEAVSVERHLHGVLAAVAEVLLPVVPFASIGIVSFEGGRHDLYDLHVVGVPRGENETLSEFLQRTQPGKVNPPMSWPGHELIPYEAHEVTKQKMDAGTPFTCDDLMARKGWYEHEFYLAAGGVRSYTAIPMLVKRKPIGVAVFNRCEPMAFTAAQLDILSAVARAIAVAVANALANEEIRKLREQLEAENLELRSQLGQAPWFEDIVGSSPALRRVLEAVEQVAPTDATVLITGATGTGKELIARALHRRSPRARGPLVKVNCSAIPETLLTSELFGHERGAFTGAVERRKGRFEQAHSGTLFLDEIGELPADVQVMLLRVLQEREFERLGGSQTVRVDVRLVTATNRDLAEAVRAGQFRSDLYYRLNVFPIHLPPLRERPEDIPALVAHFAGRHAARFGRSITRIDRRLLSALESYAWPGNIRELENVVERAVILSKGGTLRLEHDALPSLVSDAEAGRAGSGIDVHLRDQQRGAIEAALRATRGRVAGPGGAAQRLGLAPSTLEFRIKRLGIDKFQYRNIGSLKTRQ